MELLFEVNYFTFPIDGAFGPVGLSGLWKKSGLCSSTFLK